MLGWPSRGKGCERQLCPCLCTGLECVMVLSTPIDCCCQVCTVCLDVHLPATHAPEVGYYHLKWTTSVCCSACHEFGDCKVIPLVPALFFFMQPHLVWPFCSLAIRSLASQTGGVVRWPWHV